MERGTKRNRRWRWAGLITAAAVAVGFVGSLLGIWGEVPHNNRALKAEIRGLASTLSDGEQIHLSNITPFQWDSVYSFEPYASKEEMEKIMSVSSPHLQETVSEGMVQLIFVAHEDNGSSRVVASVCAYPDSLGCSIDLGYFYGRPYMRVSRDMDLLTFHMEGDRPCLRFEGEIFHGTVVELLGESALVHIDAGEKIRNSGEEVFVFLGEDLQKQVKVGDRLRVTYDGWVQETAPLQVPGVLGIELIPVSEAGSDGKEFDQEQGDLEHKNQEQGELEDSEQKQSGGENEPEEERYFQRDGKYYEKVQDLIDGRYYWASVVDEGNHYLDSHGHENTDYNTQNHYFETLNGTRSLTVRRWDNLLYSAGEYLVYEYDGTTHVADSRDLYHPVLSFTGRIAKMQSGYLVIPESRKEDQNEYALVFYDEAFQERKTVTGYRTGDWSGAGPFVEFFGEDGMMPVRDMETGLMGFMDTDGDLAISCQYSGVNPFYGGYAAVLVGAELIPYTEDSGTIPMFDTEGGQWGIIDTSGAFVVEPSESYANAERSDGTDYYWGTRRFMPVKEDGTADFISIEGQKYEVLETVQVR